MVIWIIDVLLDIVLGDILCGAICLYCIRYITFIKKTMTLHHRYRTIVYMIFPFSPFVRRVGRPLKRLRSTHPWLLLCSLGSLLCLDTASVLIMASLMKTSELGMWIKLWIIVTDCLGLLWHFVYTDDDGGDSHRDDFHGDDAPDEPPPSPPEDDGLTPTADAAERWLSGLADTVKKEESALCSLASRGRFRCWGKAAPAQ